MSICTQTKKMMQQFFPKPEFSFPTNENFGDCKNYKPQGKVHHLQLGSPGHYDINQHLFALKAPSLNSTKSLLKIWQYSLQ